MLEELKTHQKVVGVKQLRRAILSGKARKVFLARNADPRLTEPVAELCVAQDVSCVWVGTMLEIGKACGIDVGAAAAGIVH